MSAQIAGVALNPQNLVTLDINTSTVYTMMPPYQQISSGSYTMFIQPNSDVFMTTTDRGNLSTSYFSFSTAATALVGNATQNLGIFQNGSDFAYYPLVTRITPFTSNGYGVAWSGALWVAVGNGICSIATSTDGISWTPRDLLIVITNTAYGVAWNGYMWVVAGYSGGTTTTYNIATSFDGITWTGRYNYIFSGNAQNPYLGSIIWNGSYFLTGANQGSNTQAYSSPDGITWSVRGSTAFTYFYKVAWNGVLFVATVGTTSANVVQTSPDGITWTSRTILGTQYSYGIVWIPTLSLWVLSCVYSVASTNYIQYSFNGINWVTGTGLTSQVASIFDVQWNGTTVVAGGATYIFYSIDGIAWTQSSHGLNYIYALAWAPSLVPITGGTAGRWVANTFGNIFVYTNTNNASSGWTAATVPFGIASLGNTTTPYNYPFQITWNGTIFVACVYPGGSTPNYYSFLYSPDGITWFVPNTQNTGSFFNAATGITWSPQLNLWCATGNGLNSFATSPDGINWTPRGTSGVTATARGIAWNPSLNHWLVCGDAAGTYGTNCIATSTDGINWSGRAGTNLMNFAYAAVWAPQINLWVVVGSAGNNTLATSIDGITWIGRGNILYNPLYCVAWNGTLFVTGGAGGIATGIVNTATNAITWTARTIPIGNVYGITWSQKLLLWIATGQTTNTIATSPDGITWTGRGNIFTSLGYGIAYSTQLNQLVAVGSGTNTIATSVDGTNWVGMTGLQALVYQVYTVVFNGQIWVAGGTGVYQIATSLDGILWTPRTSVITSVVYAVAWNAPNQTGSNIVSVGSYYWMAVGTGTCTYASSQDGITWTNRGTTALSTGYDIVWCPVQGYWVAVGIGASNNFATGIFDGSSWTGRSSILMSTAARGVAVAITTLPSGFLTANNVYNYTLTTTMIVAVGGGSTTALATSQDGVTWTAQLGVNSIFSTTGAFGVAYSPSLNIWVAVGAVYSHAIAWSTVPNSGSWTGVTGNTLFSQGNGVIWNGIMFVAVGTGTYTTATSYDGKTWKGGALNSSSAVTALQTVGIRIPIMVAGGSSINTAVSSTIAVSYDGGLTWIPRGKLIFTTACYCVAWNGTIWVAGGTGTNNFASSTDGYNWTGRGTLLLTTAVFGLVWSSSLGIWVAVGYGTYQIVSSYDGITWTQRGGTNTIFTTYATAIGWNGTLFIALGAGSNSVALSKDGVNWSALGLPFAAATAGNTACQSGLAWNGNVWVAGTNATTAIWSSPDGINWTSRSNSWSGGVSSIAYGNNIFVAAGYTSTSSYYNTSPDGITWTLYNAYMENSTINSFATSGIYGVSWNPYSKLWFMTGYDSGQAVAGNVTTMISNPDPVNNSGNWLQRMSLPYALGNNVSTSVGPWGIIWTGTRFIAAPMISNVVARSNVLTSENGVSWKGRTQIFTTTTFLYGFGAAYNSTYGYIIVFGGVSPPSIGSTAVTNAVAPIWYSSDGGITYTTFTPVWGTNYVNTVACAVWYAPGAYWVIGTCMGNGSTAIGGYIFTSTGLYAQSGYTLRNTTVFTGAGMCRAIIWNGLTISGSTVNFIACGWPTTTVGYSPDGITWTGSGAAVTTYGFCGCWVSQLNLWLAGGGGIAKATGGGTSLSWTSSMAQSAPLSYTQGLATNGLVIVAVGQGNPTTICYSTDATTWYNVTNSLTLFGTGNGVTWNGSIFVATFTINASNLPSTAFSVDGINWTSNNSFGTQGFCVAYQGPLDKTYIVNNAHWTGRTSQQTFRIIR